MDKEEIKKRIKEIEALWNIDIKRTYGGGLDSKINMELLILKNELNKL